MRKRRIIRSDKLRIGDEVIMWTNGGYGYIKEIVKDINGKQLAMVSYPNGGTGCYNLASLGRMPFLF